MENQGPAESHATRASIFDQLRSSDLKARELACSEFRARYAPVIAGFANQSKSRMTQRLRELVNKLREMDK